MDIYSESASWMWGLSLIAVTIIVHAIGVVSMAFGMTRIRLRLEERHLGLRYAMPIVIGVVAVIGLMLTVLHGIEAAIWAATYRWLGAFDSNFNAILFFPWLADHGRCRGAGAATALADHGCAGGCQRCATLRYQHGLHFRGHADLLAVAPSSHMSCAQTASSWPAPPGACRFTAGSAPTPY